MKNKQPNGQKFGPKMARALLQRCNELEDCVVSQQKTIAQLESQIVNDSLGHNLMKERYDKAMAFLELNRPEILQLMKVHAKHGALAAAGKLPTVTVKLTKARRKPVLNGVPEVPEVPVAHAPMLPAQAQDRLTPVAVHPVNVASGTSLPDSTKGTSGTPPLADTGGETRLVPVAEVLEQPTKDAKGRWKL